MTRSQVVGFCFLVSLANACLAADSTSPESWGRRADGQAFTAHFIDRNDDGQFLFDDSGEQKTVHPSDLVVWGAYADRDQGTQIVLTNGGVLVADLLEIESDEIIVAGRLWAETRLPRDLVRAVVFRPPMDLLTRDRLFYRAAKEVRTEDRLLLENGDQLSGQLAGPARPEPGGFNPTTVSWMLRDRSRSISVPLDRVVALFFASPEPASSALAQGTIVGFRDGSWLFARQFRRRKRGLEIALPGGFQLSTEPTSTSTANPWDCVVLLQPMTSRVTYLSDLEPLGYKHEAYLEMNWPYRRDRSVSGGRLRHGGHVVMKGIGMHSSARLAYDLDGRYRWFEAELAVDQRAGRQGSVSFRVYVQNDRGQWSNPYESGIVRGAQPAIPLRVDVHKARSIALIVDFAERADQWDHADWLNARLISSDR